MRYLSEGTSNLRDVAMVTASLAERELEAGDELAVGWRALLPVRS